MAFFTLPKLLTLFLTFTLLALSCNSRLIFSGVDNCVACMGSLYNMCETNITKFSCHNTLNDCLPNNFAVKTNMLDKCNLANNGSSIFSSDTQCFDTYYITKDYIGNLNLKTLSVTLAKNTICAIQIVNKIGNGVFGFIQPTNLNRANVTYRYV